MALIREVSIIKGSLCIFNLRVRVYTCTYVRMYIVCMYVCMYICVYVLCTYVYTYVYMCNVQTPYTYFINQEQHVCLSSGRRYAERFKASGWRRPATPTANRVPKSCCSGTKRAHQEETVSSQQGSYPLLKPLQEGSVQSNVSVLLDIEKNCCHILCTLP